MISFCTPHHGRFVYISDLCDLNFDSLKKFLIMIALDGIPMFMGRMLNFKVFEDVHDKSVYIS
jgi:hypothetical protein